MCTRPTDSSTRLVALLNAERVDFNALCLQCRHGLDVSDRAEAWKVIMGYYTLTPQQWPDIDKRTLEEYTSILESLEERREPERMENGATATQMIALDVPRTMTSLHFFSGTSSTPSSTSLRFDTSPSQNTQFKSAMSSFTDTQKSLFRVLVTSARVNPGLSYLQGMNELAAHILYAYSRGDPSKLTPNVEAAAFFSFQTLLIHLGDDFTSIHADGKPGVVATVTQFSNMLLFFDPTLHTFLAELGVHPEMFALRWLMLLFTQEFNIADALRVWDFLLSFGNQLRTVALYVAVAMCYEQREALLRQPNLSDVMLILLDFPDGDVNVFLRIAVRWIRTYGVDFAHSFRNATPAEIAQWRQAHGLERGPSLANRFGSWLQSFVDEPRPESQRPR